MALQRYFPEKRKFRRKKTLMIQRANTLIAEYQAQGLMLTLRQLYYRFVSRNWLPNTIQSYGVLGEAISDGRMNGDIDWSAIEDRHRHMGSYNTWLNPAEIIRNSASGFRLDRWADQDVRVELWVEKDALSGVFDSLCWRWQVPVLACKGYVSQSTLRQAGFRIKLRALGIDPDTGKRGQPRQKTIVLHFGDHDPSGLDMTRDNTERLSIFAEYPVTMKRLALNYAQVEQYEPPPNPAKDSDVRFKKYAEEFGESSWELDALEPRVLNELAEREIVKHISMEDWHQTERLEAEHRAQLAAVSSQFPKIVKLKSVKKHVNVTYPDYPERTTSTEDESDDTD